MIRSFASVDARSLFEGRSVDSMTLDIQQAVLMKLQILNAATTLHDLKVATGCDVEELSGDRSGKHCIAVQGHARLCFKWKDGHAFDVELFGHH